MKKNRALEDFLLKVESEGLGYALLEYLSDDDLREIAKASKSLAQKLGRAREALRCAENAMRSL